MTGPLPALADRLASADSVVFLTGAGISAESGLATFREAMTGHWSRFRPEDLATPEAFARQPDTVWRWYRWRRQQAARAEPNSGHVALARLQSMVPNALLVTQNVDGLHQRAGSDDVIELHGSLATDRCSRAGCQVTMPCADSAGPPACPECGSRLRPAVIWFGECLPEGALLRAREAAGRCDLFFSIGTSSQVYPAAELALLAAGAGASVVEINPAATPLTAHAQYVIEGPGGVVLPRLLRQYERLIQSGVSA